MAKRYIKTLIFVDCEAIGKSPSTGKLTEFSAVAYPSRATFHGVLVGEKRSKKRKFLKNLEEEMGSSALESSVFTKSGVKYQID